MAERRSRIVDLLLDWSEHAERYWYQMPDALGLGCYGTGYNAWGVQTNQKYLSAMAVLGTLGQQLGQASAEQCWRARARALAALRFSLHSHLSGGYRCTDGTQWGHTWISALGIERMMHGVYLLTPYLTDEDRAALRRVLVSESEWLLCDYERGAHRGIVGDPWNHTGKNVPESNLWNGAILWRTAAMYPDLADAPLWQERAHQFLVNAVSVPSDAEDNRIVAGKPVRERHVGPNFFPNYALDHHGYLNVGYVLICLSNAAMLHFDMRALRREPPPSLFHHLADLWVVARRFVFGNGRFARIGGDSRLRYTYCQEYLLPALLLAVDQLGERHAAQLLDGHLGWIEQEVAFNGAGDAENRGSFYGRRLAPLIESSPYYYTRLESDRACALGMTLAYLQELPDGQLELPPGGQPFAASIQGGWSEPEHGAVLHRSAFRLASFAWRAHGLAQGMCTPPDDGHLAEWSHNLAGVVRFLGDDGVIEGGQTRHRQLAGYHVDTFAGGFATCGRIDEGVDLVLAEGWRGHRSAVHQIAFVALPDAHTVIGLQHCRTGDHRTFLTEVKGLHLNLPNDLFNGFQRQLTTELGQVVLQSPANADQVLGLGGLWANVEGRIGVVGVYGDKQLVVHRSQRRRGGKYASLYVDEICLGCHLGTWSVDPETLVLDAAWAVLSGVGVEQTQAFARHCVAIEVGRPALRAVRLRGLDGVVYVVLAHFGDHDASCRAALFLGDAACARDLASAQEIDRESKLSVKPGRVRVLVLG